MTPYSLAKSVEHPDPRLSADLKALIERHVRDHWTIGKTSAMSTEAIEKQLCAYGVRYTRERYLRLAQGRDSAWSISEVWFRDDPVVCRGKEEDFLGLAACELWKRLLADRPSQEMLDDWMQDGYALVQANRTAEACDAWWRVWCRLLPRFTTEMRTTRATESVFNGSQFVSNWCQDFEEALGNAALREPRVVAIGRRFCTEWIAQFTGEEDTCQVNFRRALAGFHFYLGEIAEGEKVLRGIVERYPLNAWGYIALADTYSHPDPVAPGPPRDVALAIKYLEQGLAAVPPSDPDREELLDRRAEIEATL